MYLPVWTTRADQEREVRKRASKGSPEAKAIQARIDETSMDAVIAELCSCKKNPLPKIWEKTKAWSLESWEKMVSLNESDKRICEALIARQLALAAPAVGAGSALMLQAVATAPFTTGLGNEHPLENGFAFLNPYGLPYLPGSGVKGVLRQAARELAEGRFGDTGGWDAERRHRLHIGDTTIEATDIDLLFGREPEKVDGDHLRGTLRFWDVIPQIAGNRLQVDVMTPHQSDYYAQKGGKNHPTPPHDAGYPIPIFFLTVPPGSKFIFHVICDIDRLERWEPGLPGDTWQKLLKAAFEHAFKWLGFGAKTAVGYGSMLFDEEASHELQRKVEALEEARALESMSAEEQARVQARKEIEAFRALFEAASRNLYQPGTEFDTARWRFIETCQQWQDQDLRETAAELLQRTFEWGAPKKKDKKKRLREAIDALRVAP
ncbi:MAG: hypothetical protein KatS3mg121_0494 [Gammaproteobacteria bacterium]|nr:MAG: hypothetical protein KatS3mg121_0494 [Gammaproteobacteria bacterium]